MRVCKTLALCLTLAAVPMAASASDSRTVIDSVGYDVAWDVLVIHGDGFIDADWILPPSVKIDGAEAKVISYRMDYVFAAMPRNASGDRHLIQLGRQPHGCCTLARKEFALPESVLKKLNW